MALVLLRSKQVLSLSDVVQIRDFLRNEYDLMVEDAEGYDGLFNVRFRVIRIRYGDKQLMIVIPTSFYEQGPAYVLFEDMKNKKIDVCKIDREKVFNTPIFDQSSGLKNPCK